MLVNLIFSLPYLQSTGAIVDLKDNFMVMSKVGHAQSPIKYRVPQYSIPLIAFIKWQHTRDIRYQGMCAELNGIKVKVQSVSAVTIPDTTTEGSAGVRPTEVLNIDIHDAF